jgi:hypothetical protein
MAAAIADGGDPRAQDARGEATHDNQGGSV